jgi:lipoprotein-anchoring transpeptidase ErfK/SrfK
MALKILPIQAVMLVGIVAGGFWPPQAAQAGTSNIKGLIPVSGSYGAKAPNAKYNKQVVDYPTSQPPGSVVIDTGSRFLYLVQGNGKAIRYGIGVGREGFLWKGTQKISRKAEWPDWHPPAEMRAREPYLPDMMKGGVTNPLGARALYLGSSEYRIHGTAQPWTIGTAVSSGCIRLTNKDVTDLYNQVKVGATVVVQ